MPSCEPASRTDSSLVLRSAYGAGVLLSAASSRRCRRAARSANSTATKNALTAMRPNVTTTTTQGLLMAGHDRYEDRRGHPSVERLDGGRQQFWCHPISTDVERQCDLDGVADGR